MRPLVSRGLLLPSVVCAALILGPVGTAAAADSGRGASDHGTSRTTVAHGTDDADTLRGRLDALDRSGHSGLLQPLQPLLGAVTGLTGLNGAHLDASEAAAHAKAVEAANTEVRELLRQQSGAERAAAAADPVSDLLDSLQSTIDDLLKSLTSLDVGGVLGAVTGLLGTVVGTVTGLLGGGLPSLPAAG
ncbi:hypothetical protein OIE43_08275 [Streptomyces pseudovenezuelae]|uniref:hypothetical protein n=1 Tax=Streptomyces pseudovenezuelae TaxID=67350 RepID=UPI002E3036E0|nr:hypothetical protein [Streptomyces pseudovenezuelae]